MKTRRDVINGINARTMVDVEINHEKCGDLDLKSTYDLLNEKYEQLEDQYNGEIYWHLVVWDNEIVIANQNMPAALWYAHMEDYNAFWNWLRLFGWR